MASQQKPYASAGGDEEDSYPTYRDHPAGDPPGTKPTDVDLPQSQRTSPSPMLIGLVGFVLAVLIAVIWTSLT